MTDKPNEPHVRQCESARDNDDDDSELNSDPFAKTIGPGADESATDSADEQSDPQSLGRYRIEDKLGEGAFGVVYLGFDEQLDRKVAIKVATQREYQQDTASLVEEAKRFARLKHPAIVTVHDVGVDNGQCYIVTDFLQGQSLTNWLKSNRPSWQKTIEIVATLADAIAHAHVQSTIHRDIKPANVILTAEDKPVLVDFGLALTETDDTADWIGKIAGTPAYMSPEQACGRAHTIDGRTDIYSLGVVLYHMLCGRRPFRAKQVPDLLRQIREDKPQPPRQLVPALPPELERVCLTAMAKDPDQRYSTAADFADALRGVLTGSNQVAPPHDTSTSQATETPDAEPADLPSASDDSDSSISSSVRRARDAERRQVTILHCTWELLNSEDDTPAELDPEEQHEIATTLGGIWPRAIARFDGTVLSSASDELLICFGYPIGHEDSAQRAVRTGLEILEEATDLNQRLQKEMGVVVAIATAIHTGLVVVSETDDESVGESISIVGDARNVVMRLPNSIEPGSVIITDATQRLVRGFFECESLGTQKIRGAPKPIELFEVTGESAARTRIDAADEADMTPLVGRDREVGLLQDRWEEAQEGIGQVVLLMGSAGLGKSRLVYTIRHHVLDEFGGKVDADPTDLNPILEWRCSPYYQGSGLYAATDFFNRTLSLGRDESPAVKLERLTKYLSRFNIGDPNEVVPLIASMLSIPYADNYPPLEMTPPRQKERTLETLLDWLRDYAAQQPLLFIVEDLHWVDSSTLEFLSMVVGQGQHDSLLALLTCRPEFEPPWGSVAHQTQVSLSRLRKRQIAEMMKLKTGICDLPSYVVDQIVERTDGIPLFVEEFTQMVWESGGLREIDGEVSITDSFSLTSIPATLQDLVIARLDRMESDREVVQLAATLGREFTWETLAAVHDGDDETLQGELTKLVDADLIIPRGRPPECTYQFKHALIQDAAYDSLLKKKRHDFHRRIGETLEESFPETIDSAELLARHFTEAGESQKAISYWLKAGLRAQSQSAVLEAINHFTSGLQLLAAQDESPARDQQELAFLLPFGNVLIQAKGYAASEVEAGFRRAYELCQRIGEGAPLFHVGIGLWKMTLVQSNFAECAEWAERLLEMSEQQTDVGVTMEAHFPMCTTQFYVANFADSVDHGERGLALYDEERCKFHSQFTGQNAGMGLRTYGALSLWAWGFPDRALRWSRAGVQLARDIKDPYSLAFGLFHLGWLHYYCGNWQEMKACGDEGRALSADLHFSLFESLAIMNQGAAFIRNAASTTEEIENGIETVREGVAGFTATGAALHLAHPFSQLTTGLLRIGRFDDAQIELDNAFAAVERSGELFALADLHRLKGELLLARSATNHDEAEACFHTALEIARGQDGKSWELRAATSLARLLSATNRIEAARSALKSALQSINEGFETRDISESKALLDNLSHRAS